MPTSATVSEAISMGKLGAAGTKVLEGAEYLMVKGLFVPPGYHRLYNAAGLTLGLFMGRQMMNVIVGHKPDGTPIAKSSVPLPLRPLHGLMNYNTFSDDPHDRWLKVADNLSPAVFGAMGAMAGSSFFFTQQIMKAAEVMKFAEGDLSKVTINRAENAIAMERSKPWWGAAGVTSIFGSASSLNWFYGFALGVNFMMKAGRKAFMGIPFLSWFSDTQASHPSGAAGLTRELMDFIKHNPALHNPAEAAKLEELAHGAFHTMVKQAPAGKVDAFVQFLLKEKEAAVEVARETKQDLAKVMSERFFGGQFEKWLVNENIVDINDAASIRNTMRIADYGAVGKPAEWIPGIKANIDNIWERYVKGMRMRVNEPHTGRPK